MAMALTWDHDMNRYGRRTLSQEIDDNEKSKKNAGRGQKRVVTDSKGHAELGPKGMKLET